MDYIGRQFKKNPEYKPHPLIRALECAIQAAEKVEVGKKVMGFSSSGSEKMIGEPYLVVLEKATDGFGVVEIRNIKVDKTLPVDVMLMVFRIQVLLDRIEGDCVGPKQMAEVLNAVIPGERFIAMGDRWREAVAEFKKQLQEGKIHIPNDPELINQFTSLTYKMTWDEYPNRVRAFIGGSLGSSLGSKNGAVFITSPIDSKFEKFKVFDTAIELLIGKSAEFLTPPDKSQKEVK